MSNKILAGMVVAVALAFTGSARAEVDITWSADYGFYDPSDNVTPLLDPAVQSTIVQLIGVGINGVIDAPLITGGVGGDDVLLQQVTYVNNANDGFSEYAAAAFGNYTQPFGAGLSFYGRIFQDNTPTAGEYYFDAAIVAASDLADPNTQLYDLNGGNTAGDILPNQIVPEPSVLAFLGIGGLVVAVRRRMVKA